MNRFDDEDPQIEKKPIPPEQLKRVWLTVILMIAGGCVSAVVITLAISWILGLKIHLP
jgi:hypothetical protein